MKQKQQNKFVIRQKYTYLLLILTVIFLTAFSAYSILNRHLNNEIIKTNIGLLDNSRINLDSRISSLYNTYIDLTMKKSTMDFMYNSPENDYDKYKNTVNIHNDLASIRLLNNLDSVYVYSGRSNTIITDTTFSAGRDFHDMDWKAFFTFTNSDSVYTVRKTDSASGKSDVLTIVYLYPMPDLYNESAVVFNISEASLFDSISNHYDEHEQFFVMDTGGKILTHSNKKKLYSYAYNMEGFNEIVKNDSGYLTAKIDGVKSTIFYTTSPMTNWKFVRITPVSPFKTIFYQAITIYLPLIILIIALALLFMKLINPWIYKPVYSFIDRVSQRIRESSSNEREVMPDTLTDFENLEDYFYSVIETNKSYNEQIQKSIPVMKWKLITDIILGNQTKHQELTDTFKLLDIDIYPKNFLVMLVDAAKTLENGENSEELYISLLASQAEALIKNITKGVAILQQNKTLCILLSFETQDNYKLHTVSIAEQLKNFAASYLQSSITVAVGDICENLSDVQASYLSAANALKYKGILGESSIIWANDIDVKDNSQLYEITLKISAFNQASDISDFSVYKARFDEILSMISKQVMPFDSVLQVSSILLAKIVTFATDMGIDAKLLNERYDGIYSKLYSLDTIEKINAYQTDVFNTVYTMISSKLNSGRSGNQIENILNYINENYMNPDMSLTLVAQTFYISEQHLSKVFKQKTATTFSNYLIDLRISHAKELLENTSVKINEIASLVGYTNIHSFIKIFKKQLGMTPLQYRNIKS